MGIAAYNWVAGGLDISWYMNISLTCLHTLLSVIGVQWLQ
jgi:hypothetical protein